MTKTIKDLSIITLFTILITLLIWIPHIFRLNSFYNLDFSQGINTIYRNFDGLEYVVIAKTFYQPKLIGQIPLALSANYYASHFPGYAILIFLFAPLFGFLKSMLFVSFIFTIASAIAFFFLVKNFRLTEKPLFLSLIFLVLPARWLVVHSVGSSEPVFIFFIITSIYYFLKFEEQNQIKFILLSAVFGFAAQITRPPGILLFASYMIYVHWRHFLKDRDINFKESFIKHLKYYPLILIPFGLVLVFYLFGLAYNDFFAYFHSGDNIHLSFFPFQVFNKNEFWVGQTWLEDIVYVFILGFSAGIILIKKKLYPIGFFVLTYMIASSFVVHRDISRYTLPVIPFVLIAFEKILTSREFKIVLAIILLGIYLYTENFILFNIAPIPNLQAFN